MPKQSNSVVVGGPIAVGKSTLVASLPFIPVQELNENDELSNLLLMKMYEGDMIAAQVFQLDLLLTRFDKYKKKANDENMHVFDRSILEDRFFAQKLLANYQNIGHYYEAIGNDKVTEMIEKVGVPKLYIYLKSDGDTFKERVFKRGRKAEIANFEKNEQYFKEMVVEYPKLMEQMFNKFNIPNIIIDTVGKDEQVIYDETMKALKEKGIVND